MKARWAEIKAVFETVFELPTTDRARALAGAEIDPWVRGQVERLLAASDAGAGVLDQPAIAGLPPLGDSSPSPKLLGRTLGPYRVVREIGRGGMGTVYEAVRTDPEFEHRVAIKTLRLGLDVPELVTQFRQERQILGALQHPNIAALLDGGVTEDGVPYIVLEYVDGVPIDRYCETNRIGLRSRLDLFRQVLDAVQYAHRQLIIHRDIKPSNILVTGDGHVKLLDFGIARLIRADGREMTQQGTSAITPAYASPEQLRGERATTATDVYSLALVLYRLLTGKSPLNEGLVTPVELLGALATGRLPAPSTDPTPAAAAAMGVGSTERLKSLLAGELDAVILKGLRPEPERRYSSVEAFADDLLRYLKGFPVSARPDTAWYRFSKFVRRRRGMVVGLVAAAVALTVGTGVAVWQASRAAAEARRASKIATFLQQMIGATAPLASLEAPRLGPGAKLAEWVDSAAGRIDSVTAGDPEINVVLHHLLGLAYQSQERPAEAAAQFDAMASRAGPIFGPGSADLVVWSFRAAQAIEAGNWPLADSLSRRVERSIAEMDPTRPDAYGRLLIQFGMVEAGPWRRFVADLATSTLLQRALIMSGRGEVAAAVAATRRALAVAESAGASVPTRAQAMGRLGFLLLNVGGDRVEGTRLLQQALRAVDSLPNPDVAARAEVIQALVSTRSVSIPEADSLGRELVRIYERATGPNSLAVAYHLFLGGGPARIRGDTLAQRTALTRARRIVEAHPNPPTALRQNVAIEYSRTKWLAGDMDSAVAIAGQVYRERVGQGGFSMAEAGQNFSSVLRIRGERNSTTRAADYRAALPILLEADSVMRSLLPAEHFWPQLTAASLVRLARDRNDEPMASRFLALLPDSARRRFDRPKP